MSDWLSRLPEGFSAPEIVEDRIVVDGLAVFRAGVAVTDASGQEVTGSAADADASPLERSTFELLERASTLAASQRTELPQRDEGGRLVGTHETGNAFPESPAPERWRYARSNGVALHRAWKTACGRALRELAERDRVLRAWYGDTVPVPLPFDVARTGRLPSESFAWTTCSFPEPAGPSFSRGIAVAGVFGFPLRPEAPFVATYGAGDDLEAALDASMREALQVVAFLWGEPLPESEPAASPSALSHLEHLLWPGHHDVIRTWLREGHARYRDDRPRSEASSDVSFLDLTPDWLRGDLFVAKASCPDALPLAFGDSPFSAHLPPALRIHPIA